MPSHIYASGINTVYPKRYVFIVVAFRTLPVDNSTLTAQRKGFTSRNLDTNVTRLWQPHTIRTCPNLEPVVAGPWNPSGHPTDSVPLVKSALNLADN